MIEQPAVMAVGPHCWGEADPKNEEDVSSSEALAVALTRAAKAYVQTWGTNPVGGDPEPVFTIFISSGTVHIDGMGRVEARTDDGSDPAFLNMGSIRLEPGTDYTEAQEGVDGEFANLS